MSGQRIDTAIGGVSEERTARGFAIYGKVTDNRGNTTRVQRSSACGGPYCYVHAYPVGTPRNLSGNVGAGASSAALRQAAGGRP